MMDVEIVQKCFLNFPYIGIIMKFFGYFILKKNKKGESVYTTLFGVYKVIAKIVLNLNKLFGL